MVRPAPETVETGLKIEALSRNVRDQFVAIAEMIPSIPRELVATINSLADPLQIAYNIANLQRMELPQSEAILEMDSTADKLHTLVGILTKEGEVLDLGKKIQNEAREEIDKVQREYFLREQLKAIRKELGEEDAQSAEVEEFRRKINDAKMPPEAPKTSQSRIGTPGAFARCCGRIWRDPDLSGLAGIPALVQDYRRNVGYQECT